MAEPFQITVTMADAQAVLQEISQVKLLYAAVQRMYQEAREKCTCGAFGDAQPSLSVLEEER